MKHHKHRTTVHKTSVSCASPQVSATVPCASAQGLVPVSAISPAAPSAPVPGASALGLSKGAIKRIRKQVVQLQRQTDALTRKDLADWRNAWQLAINIDYPNRQPLYDIYRDVEIDLHLSGCIMQREGFVLASSFKIVDADGNKDDNAQRIFDAPWFKQLMRYCLESIYWGHSLIELGDVCNDAEGLMSYNSVRLIPRKHVIPEYGRVITDLGQSWQTGIDYRQPPFSEWLIEAGAPDSLGLFLKAASQTIPKKNALAFWDTFAEIFGMPLRIAKTTLRDEKELSKMERMMADMGTEGWGIFTEGTEIEVVESTKGDSFNVYDRRIDRANSELSKAVIGQTMTIEDGSSLSQSETHLKVFQNLVNADCDMLRDIVNNQLIPRMIRHGFPVAGLRFEWDDSIDYTPEQQRAYEELIINNFDVDPKYFAEKYNMPVLQRRTQAPEPPSPNGSSKSSIAHRTSVPSASPQGSAPVPCASALGITTPGHPFFD